MTNEEEKELLIKDLCPRLKYSLMCDRLGCAREVVGINIKDNKRNIMVSLSNGDYMPSEYCIEEIKPYLRPMSSMTEEEKAYKESYFKWDYTAWDYVDWLNKKGFDYRGLIPMGLALPAKEGMYNKMEE